MTFDLGDSRPDVFISHASEDLAAFAGPLSFALRARGLRVWIDRIAFPLIRLRDRSEIIERINVAMESSRLFVPVLSPRYLSKEWPQHELQQLVRLLATPLHDCLVLPVVHDFDEMGASGLSDDAKRVLSVPGHNSREGVESVADSVLQSLQPEPRMVHSMFKGATRVMIDDVRGEVRIINSPSSGHEVELSSVCYQFSGDRLDEMDMAKSEIFALDEGLPDEAIGHERHFHRTVVYVQVSRGYCSQEDIEKGAIFNFATYDRDWPVRPFFTNGHFTAGVIDGESGRDMREWLASAGERVGRWRRMARVNDMLEYSAYPNEAMPPNERWIP